jgi:hypothetical protein
MDYTPTHTVHSVIIIWSNSFQDDIMVSSTMELVHMYMGDHEMGD